MDHSPQTSSLPDVADLPRADTLPVIVPEQRRDHKAPSLLDYPATYLLVGLNLAVFALMFRFSPAVQLIRVHAGLHVLTAEFSFETLLKFGASDAIRIVYYGEWWRLLTSTFVHVSILHIAVNMWCLWNLGLFGEPLLGKPGLIAVYVITGTAGMMLSLAWTVFVTHQDALVAGASGAIFGIAGILIVLLSNRKLSLPWKELRSLRRSVIWFALLNLAFGVGSDFLPAVSSLLTGTFHFNASSIPRIDNSAHLGGFLSGLALGLPLFPRMTSGKSSYRHRQALVFGAAFLLLCLLGYALSRRLSGS